MTFKASFNYIAIRIVDTRLPDGERKFKFTKSQIFYIEKENRNWYFDNLKVTDGDYYSLIVTDNVNRLLRYEIVINKQRPIKLALDSKNEFLLKWTHKLCYIQQEKSNWLKNIIGALLIALTTFVLTKIFSEPKSNQEPKTPIKIDSSKSILK